MIAKIFPAPLFSVFLAILWLILNESISYGNILLGLILGFLAPAIFASLRPHKSKVHNYKAAIILFFIVLWDSFISNLLVLFSLISPKSKPKNAFVIVPLELKDTGGLAMLAVITNFVPGTVWCELARDSSALILHVWNVDDEAKFIAEYKKRYEAPLIKIFEK